MRPEPREDTPDQLVPASKLPTGRTVTPLEHLKLVPQREDFEQEVEAIDELSLQPVAAAL